MADTSLSPDRTGRRVSLPVAVEAAILLVAARVLLPLRPTTAVLRLLADRRRPGAAEVDPDGALKAVRRAGEPLKAAPLPQSVALAALLRRHGRDPVVVLGCRRQGPYAWDAHAWVELGGERLEPVVEPGHTELARLSATTRWEISPN